MPRRHRRSWELTERFDKKSFCVTCHVEGDPGWTAAQQMHARLTDLDGNPKRSWTPSWASTGPCAATGSSYGQCQHAIHVLRDLCRFLEHETRHHIRAEETVFYRVVEYRLHRLRGLVGELRHEHDVFHQAFEEFRRELVHFNATGELRQLPILGRELVRILRQHIDREERELHPVVLEEFQEEDWRELHRHFARSEVA